MVIRSLRVKNLRSILKETLRCEKLTAIVGPNGSGKSSFLKALELFYAAAPQYGELDFYNGDTAQPIEIAITFAELTVAEQERFGKYIEGDSLTVVRVLSAGGARSAKYHGSSLQNADFKVVREAGSASDMKELYKDLAARPEYSDLASARSKDAIQQELAKWEAAHQESCMRLLDDGQFFGFTEVARGYLGASTQFIPIPAVRDASEDSEEGKDSTITQLMDILVRNVVASRPELGAFQEEVKRRYNELIEPATAEGLRDLSRRLTETLRSFVRDSSVDIGWLPAAQLQLPMPRARVSLVEDGYAAAVSRTGHGLQRAFILTMLQHLTVVRNSENPAPVADAAAQPTGPAALPNLILGIEEPELYQHPSRQRHFARVLYDLAAGAIPGVAESTQVLYTTHSPMFVGIDRFDQVRLVRKVQVDNRAPKQTRVVQTTLDAVADALWAAEGAPAQRFTAATLRPRLDAVMTPWVNEGFFADRAVLVEGEEDRAALLGTAELMAIDLESRGITVIPCMGKCNLDRPAVIFRQLGIPVYVVWDSDFGDGDADPRVNHRLLRLQARNVEDWPEFVGEDCACFKRTLGDTLKEELGVEDYSRWLKEEKEATGIRQNKEAEKRPLVILHILQKAKAVGKAAPTLIAIVQLILGAPVTANGTDQPEGVQGAAGT